MKTTSQNLTPNIFLGRLQIWWLIEIPEKFNTLITDVYFMNMCVFLKEILIKLLLIHYFNNSLLKFKQTFLNPSKYFFFSLHKIIFSSDVLWNREVAFSSLFSFYFLLFQISLKESRIICSLYNLYTLLLPVSW